MTLRENRLGATTDICLGWFGSLGSTHRKCSLHEISRCKVGIVHGLVVRDCAISAIGAECKSTRRSERTNHELYR